MQKFSNFDILIKRCSMNSQSYIFLDKPAKSENECFLLAGGSFEIVDDGGVSKRNLKFINSKIYPSYKIVNDINIENFNNLKKQVADENIRTNLKSNFIKNVGIKPTLPVCEIEICDNTKDFPFENYIRKLNLEHAIQRISYSVNGIMREQESFVSFNDTIYCASFKSSAVDYSLFKIKSDLTKNIKIEKLKTGSSTKVVAEITGSLENKIKISAESSESKNKYFAMIIEMETDGSVVVEENQIEIKNYYNITILAKAKSSLTSVKSAFDKCYKILEGKKYNKLLEEHKNGFSEIFNRVELKLTGKNYEGINLRKQLKKLNKYNNSDFMVLYYNYARYLMITSSSKSCSAPSPLILRPINPFYFDLFIGTQMKYWGAESGNLSECHEALFKLIKQIAGYGKSLAKDIGLNGWYCFNSSNMFGETTITSDDAKFYSGTKFFIGIAGTLCKHLLERYEYTEDREFLAQVFDIIEESVKFYLSYLTEREDKLMLCPSQVLINNRFYLTKCSALDMAVIRDLFNKYLDCCKILKINNKTTKETEDKLLKLYPYTVSDKNTIAPAIEREFFNTPSTFSMYGLYPSDEMLGNLKLCKAAFESLKKDKHKLYSTESVYKAMCYTRLGYGDMAFNIIRKLLKYRKNYNSKSKIGTNSNLFSSESVSFDINLGIMAIMNEMFVQKQNDTGILLPALSTTWKEGSIKGIKCKGNLTVDIYWKNNKVYSFKICGKQKTGNVFVNGKLKTYETNKIIAEL